MLKSKMLFIHCKMSNDNKKNVNQFSNRNLLPLIIEKSILHLVCKSKRFKMNNKMGEYLE